VHLQRCSEIDGKTARAVMRRSSHHSSLTAAAAARRHRHVGRYMTCPRALNSDYQSIFQLINQGHRACRWCGSSYSTRIPSLKFVYAFPFRRYGWFSGHGVKRPSDLDLWPFVH